MDAGDSSTPGEVRNEMAGTIHGGVVQAGAVHGDIHFHTGIPQAPVPRQLLPAPAHFTDRESELAELDELARSGERMLAVLTGPGGVGKTALAMQWAHRVHDRYPDGQMYVDLGGFGGEPPMSPQEALGLFLRGLGLAPQHVPVDLAEQAALYRSLTARRSLILLLDNASDALQVRPLLPNSSTSAVVVTSRTRLTGLFADGARLLDIRPLVASSAVALLAKAVGDDRIGAEPDGAEALAGLCGGLPIAVRMAAARLASHPKWPVRRVVSELADEQFRLATLSPSTELSIQTTFDLSYRALDHHVATAYRTLALHPGQTFGPAVAASVLGCGLAGARRVLDQLIDNSLLEEVAEDRYRYHDLVKLHARQQIEDREAPLRHVLEWYLAGAMAADRIVTPHRRRLDYAFHSAPAELPRFDSREDALAWLELERANLIAAGQAAMASGWAELTWHLSDVMWPLLLHRKHYRDRLAIDQRGVDAARRWGNRFAEADMLKRLGRVSTTLGLHHEAEQHLRASMELATANGDQRGAADAREALALLYAETGRTAEAVTEFSALVDANQMLGAHRSLGLSLIHLGTAMSHVGQFTEAQTSLARALAIFDALPEPDPYNRARVLVTQAEVHCRAREFDRADDIAGETLGLMRELGSPEGAARSHEVLALVARNRGDDTEAVEHLRAAAHLFTSLGSPRARAVSDLLDNLVGADPQPPT
ncbi:NTPase [Lentzea sp. NBRC 105346]|uniref:NB-ARC domain-containing protein n=1 Tax=Lentzea sp. NBRC 105346 TaxID=3032205 RepID=UPI0024A13E13|nr:NB-ARC domain-containing protein [Lentzea sp. NBRC 105346]GLZ31943.1 NTPase [Lentzea sp. NBRC 105346]